MLPTQIRWLTPLRQIARHGAAASLAMMTTWLGGRTAGWSFAFVENKEMDHFYSKLNSQVKLLLGPHFVRELSYREFFSFFPVAETTQPRSPTLLSTQKQ